MASVKLESRSEKLRKEGNSLFVSATKDFAPSIQVSRFQKALAAYENAYNISNMDEELSSCAKNIAVTSWKITGVQIGMSDLESCPGKWPEIKHYFTQTMKYFCNAYRTGQRSGKPQVWLDNVLSSSKGCWENLKQTVFPLKYKHLQTESVLGLIEYISSTDIQADCFLDLAANLFHKGLNNISEGNYKECLVEMKECYFPMNEAKRLGVDVDRIQVEVRILEEDVFMHTCLAESMKSRATGDALFDEVLLDQELLNIDMIWEVIDWYKDSILKVRNLDVKEEAISLSRIGVVYDKVLKIKFRAKEYLKKAMELAHSVTPFFVGHEVWYQNCTEVLARYQRETVKYEEEEEKKRKAEVLEELKPELEDLKSHEEDDYKTFLTHVYKTYPPKNAANKLDLTMKEGEEDYNVKYRVIQKAIIHYHPDKVKEDEHGLKAKVLFEEITKYLTKRYEQVKSMK